MHEYFTYDESSGITNDTNPSKRHDARLPGPDKFDGAADHCRGFVCQCEVFFAHQPTLYDYHLPETFTKLKQSFNTASILHHPEPESPFTVEVDASNTGIGAVLSQRVGGSSKLHPCAFYSRKLSTAERNYDMGNRELLFIKVTLEEWRHWLEGARHAFLVLTDHRNLEFTSLWEVKRLNPCQA
ncbi:hypothetical protein QTP70_021272 [Hemibagrus guttatus]|uniref:Reverse transcriptase/retrotransposon-derived protein RNase H-like domain-containing protein n=1 Tax=Hemibagrus guttatus TaxID=175788 RepID=A0AAE0RAH7_9TELE|nr:hypothetical protein QTP70_021272 [Hemibagrus guttatus]